MNSQFHFTGALEWAVNLPVNRVGFLWHSMDNNAPILASVSGGPLSSQQTHVQNTKNALQNSGSIWLFGVTSKTSSHVEMS